MPVMRACGKRVEPVSSLAVLVSHCASRRISYSKGMSGRDCDIAIVGGGLSGGLIAAALATTRPEISVRLIEAGEKLGGNHRWSWFSSDLSPQGRDLLHPFSKTVWDTGYDVRFPDMERTLTSRYRSLASPDFDAGLRRLLPDDAIRTQAPVATLDSGSVTLEDGQRLSARSVIDCRGQASSPHLTGGWQIFLGRHIRTQQAHGVTRPVIMDASVEQLGGYRFVYVLPLGAHELFIEDTYYADDPVLDRIALSRRIDEYCAAHGWDGDIIGNETGILPVITGGNFRAFQNAQRVPGVACAGAKGGFTHPLTSYSVPQAVQIALEVAQNADLPGNQLSALMEARARQHWGTTRFYRLLGTMLFGAARPEERWRIFQRFYRLPEALIERFYAARSTRMDRARVLCGKPPVPIGRAMGALLRPGTPMASDGEKDRQVA